MNGLGEPATAAKHSECLEEYRGAGGDDDHPAPLLHSLPHHNVQRAHAVQGRQDLKNFRTWIFLLVPISSFEKAGPNLHFFSRNFV